MASETISTRAYGTVAGIEDLIGDVANNGRQFDSENHPTELTVIRKLNFVAAELNLELTRAGYVVDVSTGLSPTTYPDLHNFVTEIANKGAASEVLATMPRSSYVATPSISGDELPRDRRQQFFIDFRNGLKKISTWGRYDPSKIRVGSATDADGNIKVPFFVRSTGSVPSAHPLTTTTALPDD